jgi:putative Holliday junction resolvase
VGNRVLAIDYGDRRVGLAVSDALGMTAQPVGHIVISGAKDCMRQLEKYVLEYAPKKIVLGLPKNMDGSEGARAETTREFGNRLEGRFRVPVDFFDERLTSVSAERALRGLNVRGDRRKGRTDTLAAVLILQNYLEVELNGPDGKHHIV